MGKKKVSYICSNCGNIFSKWAGCCSFCIELNSLRQEDVVFAEFSIAFLNFVLESPLKDVGVLLYYILR